MKHHLQQLVSAAIQQLQTSVALVVGLDVQPLIERTKDCRHDDFASSAALLLAQVEVVSIGKRHSVRGFVFEMPTVKCTLNAGLFIQRAVVMGIAV